MNEDLTTGDLPRGLTPPSGRGGRLLGDVLVELGFAERENVEQAVEASRAAGKRLGSTLLEMGILSEDQLGRAIAERYRLDYLDLEEFDVDPEAAQVVGEKEMKRYEAAPVALTDDGALVVAMVDPADWLAAEEIARLTGRRVRRAVASPAGIAQVIARVVEASAGEEEDAGKALEDSTQAPARLTLRRVANPLRRRPAATAAPPGEEPNVAAPSEEDSAASADEPSAPETAFDVATGPSPDAPQEHGREASTPEAGRAPSDAELDEARRDLVFARTELEATRSERTRLDTELRATRAELAETRSELTAVRAWTDAALKRAVDGERGVGDARADVSRLEAELAAARDQAESLRADLSWARRQIEKKDEREDQTLADLRDRIEAMESPPATPAEPEPDEPRR